MIIGMRLARGLTVSASVVALAVMAMAAAAQNPESAQARSAAPPESTAQLAGVSSELDQLKKLSTTATPVDRWQLLWLHQRITEQVMTASLQVDAILAKIDNEVARANELRGYLADSRDRTVTRDNLLSVIVGGGLGATSSAMQFSSNLSRPGDAVGIGAGLASVGFGLLGIRAQAGRSSRFDFDSNLLAEIFDRPALPDSHYPATIWTFLNQEPLNVHGITRKQELLRTWVQVRRIDSLASTAKIDRVTSEPSEGLKLSIDDLEDRAAMLQDVRARISFLKRDLATLLASLPDAPASLTDPAVKSAP
jgi:hypothetical protein